MRLLTLIISILLTSTLVFGQLTVDFPMAEHAIIQRDQPIVIKGTTSMNTLVFVEIDDHRYEAITALNGVWTATIPKQQAGGPHKVKITGGSRTINYKDIWFGDVWVASGQSNMEWPIDWTENPGAAKADADYPLIREFRVDHVMAVTPDSRLAKGEWVKANANTIGNFSAVAFYFARRIWQETNIPIGIIHSSWGGSQAESWIPIDKMKTSPPLAAYANAYKPSWDDIHKLLNQKHLKKYIGSINAQPNLADEARYPLDASTMESKPSTWPMGSWDWKGAFSFRGSGYQSTRFDLPAYVSADSSTISLGSCHCEMNVWVNGKQVVNTISNGKNIFKLGPIIWREKDNYLVLKIGKPLDTGWTELGIHGSNEDLHIVTATGQKLALGGYTWRHVPAFAEKYEYIQWMNNGGSILYNAMIAPITHSAIKGVIWYQGESNDVRAAEYASTFKLLIESWRAAWGHDFPFYFVELSSYGPRQSSNEGSNWAELRESQQKVAASLPKTAIVTTTDIGNAGDIHPGNKLDVGLRLANYALRDHYGVKTDPEFPMYNGVKYKKSSAIVSFNYVTEWKIKDDYGYIHGFEIAGADGKWYFAQAKPKGKDIEVFHPKNQKPIAVRYAWANAPTEANVFGSNGLPMRQFRTDNYKGITEGVSFWP